MGDLNSRCCSTCDKSSQYSRSLEDQLPYPPYGLAATTAQGAGLDSSSATEHRNQRSREDNKCDDSRLRHESSIAGDDAMTAELVVDISKSSPHEDLGLRVLHGGVGVLVVADIYAGGSIDKANSANSLAGRPLLEVGDQIALVNDVGGDDRAMAEECKRARHLRLGIRRLLSISRDSSKLSPNRPAAAT
mmetsp:Transcript_68633/g.108872  ORF Transcript_68633/g.108872 Transcript_68633/m.108872 type:complete len:190 (-) Transcript_68633:154-723(-)